MTNPLDTAREALAPFAECGNVFMPVDPNDDSPWATAPDDLELQLGAAKGNGWTIKVGDLRRAARALAAPVPEAKPVRRPTAWMRGVHAPSTPNGPDEWDADFVYGDDRPEGEGWQPLYAIVPESKQEGGGPDRNANNDTGRENIAPPVEPHQFDGRLFLDDEEIDALEAAQFPPEKKGGGSHRPVQGLGADIARPDPSASPDQATPSQGDVEAAESVAEAYYLECSKRGGTHTPTLSQMIAGALTAARAESRTEVDLVAHLRRQKLWSEKTFGPGQRLQGVLDHIRKELREIEADPGDLEWIDVVILALDGAWRQGYSPEAIAAALVAKQAKNEARKWPDWHTADPDKAIEHDRSEDRT